MSETQAPSPENTITAEYRKFLDTGEFESRRPVEIGSIEDLDSFGSFAETQDYDSGLIGSAPIQIARGGNVLPGNYDPAAERVRHVLGEALKKMDADYRNLSGISADAKIITSPHPVFLTGKTEAKERINSMIPHIDTPVGNEVKYFLTLGDGTIFYPGKFSLGDIDVGDLDAVTQTIRNQVASKVESGVVIPFQTESGKIYRTDWAAVHATPSNFVYPNRTFTQMIYDLSANKYLGI